MTYLRRCNTLGMKAGILYMHNISSNPQDANLAMSKHLKTFYRVYTGGVSSTVTVPTIVRGARLSDERIQAQILSLTREATKWSAPVCKLFDGKPESAWAIVQELLKQMDPGTA